MENPVLGREFVTSIRTRKAVAFGLVFFWLLAGAVMLMWPAGGAMSLAAQSSRELFVLLAMGQLILVVTVAPAFTAVCVTVEKERETYDLLYHTLLRPGQIVFGKLAAGVGFVLILLAGALPMMGACLVLGGVGWRDVAGVYAVLAAAALLFGLLGIACSYRFRTSYKALILCYVGTLVVCGLTWLPSVILGKWAQDWSAIHMIRGCSPFAAMLSVVNPAIFAAEHGGAATGLAAFADTMQPFLLFAGGAGVLLLAGVLRMAASPPRPRRRRDESVIDERMELLKRHVKFPFYLFDPRRRKKMIGRFLNVIAVKEMRTKAFGRIVWLIRAIYISVIVSFVLAFVPITQIGYVDIPVIILVCLSIPLGMIVLVSPVLTSSAISEEIESGVFDALRMTRLGPFTIVLGKLEVAWLFVTLLVVSTFPALFILAFLGSSMQEMETMADALARLGGGDFAGAWRVFGGVDLASFTGMLRALAVAGVSILFATVTGIFCSTLFRKSSAATSVAYGVIFAFAFGTLVPYFVADNLPYETVRWFVTLNPFAAAGKAASGVVFTDYPAGLWLDHVVVIGAASAVVLVAAAARVWWLMRPDR